jgi:hypothetical protein
MIWKLFVDLLAGRHEKKAGLPFARQTCYGFKFGDLTVTHRSGIESGTSPKPRHCR